jgi:hypothetical protein
MEKNRDLFKEAIADAKAVKEVSIANAKAALEEVITPRLKSMFEKKLTEMEEEDEKQEEGYKMKKEGSELEEEFNLEELLAELDEVEHEDEDADHKMEAKHKMEAMHDEEETEDVETIEEELTEEEDAEETEDESEEEEEEESKVDDMDVEIDFDNMTEEDLRAFIEEVVDEMIEAEELKLTDMEDDSEEVEMDDEAEMGDEEIEIEDEIADLQLEEGQITEMTTPELIAALPSIIGGMTALIGGSIGASVWLTNAEEGKYGDKWKAFAEKLSGAGGAAKSVKEDLKAIETLNQELTEVNLLNSKLLYLNKILKESNLKESQKVKAITAFDKAETVKEAKLVYETLKENLSKTPAKETQKKLVRESKNFASSTIAGNSPVKKPVMEVDPTIQRMKKLAGLA